MVLTKSKAIILAAALILAAACMGAAALQREQMALAEKLIRLHVVANSDSEADQAVKLQVRDAVLAVTQPLTAGEDPYGALAGALPEIQQAAEDCLAYAGGVGRRWPCPWAQRNFPPGSMRASPSRRGSICPCG